MYMKDRGKMEAPLHICVVTGSFYPIGGGGERHARLLCREWAARGAQVTVVTRRRTKELPEREDVDGFTILRVGPAGFPRCGKYLMIFPALWTLWKIRRSCDIMYVAGLRVLGCTGILAQFLFRKPCILRSEAMGEFNGAFIWKPPGERINRPLRWIFKPLIGFRNIFFRRAACFLSISTPIQEEYLACGVPPERIAAIPNGYDPAIFHPPPSDAPSAAERRKALGLPSEGLLYVYSGKLIRGKGLEHLIRVWAKVHPVVPEARLVLVGSGGGQFLSCEDLLHQMVRDEGLAGSVHFTGYVENVADYLRAADLFVFPSESEAQTLAILETLACGLPILASDIPGIKVMVENNVNGRLIPPDDEAAWIREMTAFAADPEPFRQRAATALQTVKADYSISSIADRHLALFHRLASS